MQKLQKEHASAAGNKASGGDEIVEARSDVNAMEAAEAEALAAV